MSEHLLFFMLGMGAGVGVTCIVALWGSGVRSMTTPPPRPEYPRTFQKVGPRGIEPITVTILIPPEARP